MERNGVVDGSTAVVKTQMKLSASLLPPSSPTIQHPTRSTRADVMGGNLSGSYVRVHVAGSSPLLAQVIALCSFGPGSPQKAHSRL